jgi:3-hydroxybutyryl-CoA dehydrogenase
MGAGIAQLAVEAGDEVVLNDVDDEAIDRGRERIRDGLSRRAARLDLDADSIDDWVDGRLDRLRDARSLDAVAAEADVIIEAVIEDLDLKRTVFRTLDAVSSPDVILATNTSALSVAAIATAARRPERVLGLHFFNPAPIMKLVEVVVPPETAPAVADTATRLVASWDRVPIRCTDTPGFIVNRVNRPFTLEALALLEAGESDVESIDDAIRAAGFPMGPFELMDLVGIDVNLAAARSIFEAFAEARDPLAERFRPSPIQERLVEAGRLGRKSGEGFYSHADGRTATIDLARSADRPVEKAEIVERIRLAIVAEAYRAEDDGVAKADDIDLALRLGAGHPSGPFEWAATVGGREVVLERLAARTALGPRFLLSGYPRG